MLRGPERQSLISPHVFAEPRISPQGVVSASILKIVPAAEKRNPLVLRHTIKRRVNSPRAKEVSAARRQRPVAWKNAGVEAPQAGRLPAAPLYWFESLHPQTGEARVHDEFRTDRIARRGPRHRDSIVRSGNILGSRAPRKRAAQSRDNFPEIPRVPRLCLSVRLRNVSNRSLREFSCAPCSTANGTTRAQRSQPADCVRPN